MPKRIIKPMWVTSDDKEFPSEEAATIHEGRLAVEKFWEQAGTLDLDSDLTEFELWVRDHDETLRRLHQNPTVRQYLNSLLYPR